MRRRPEDVVAAVNGFVVLLVPVFAAVAIWLFGSSMDAPVRPQRSVFENALRAVFGIAPFIAFAAPGAVVAGWRSRAHAKRSIERGRYSWRGVLEAGAFGFIVTGLLMARACVMTQIEAPGRFGVGLYAGATLVYGGIVLVPALVIGLLLQLTGMLTLKLCLGRQS